MRMPRLKTGAYKSKELSASGAPSFSPYRTKGQSLSIAQVNAHRWLPDEG
jgi:hypothetical protein